MSPGELSSSLGGPVPEQKWELRPGGCGPVRQGPSGQGRLQGCPGDSAANIQAPSHFRVFSHSGPPGRGTNTQLPGPIGQSSTSRTTKLGVLGSLWRAEAAPRMLRHRQVVRNTAGEGGPGSMRKLTGCRPADPRGSQRPRPTSQGPQHGPSPEPPLRGLIPSVRQGLSWASDSAVTHSRAVTLLTHAPCRPLAAANT